MKAQSYFQFFIFILIVKVFALIILAYTGIDFFGGGNDSEYYHDYAIGSSDVSANSWPILLRALNEVSLYSREGVSHALKILGFLFVPLAVAAICKDRHSPIRARACWAAALVTSIYPTIIYYTTDIYREVFMLSVWLGGVYLFKHLSETRRASNKLFYSSIGILFSILLYALRPYLGLSYFAALIFSRHYSFRSSPPFGSLILLVAVLFLLYIAGAFQHLLAYRALFSEEIAGGSTLGIRFMSAADFVPDLLRSTAFQLFGFYFPNVPSVLVFFAESLPFIFIISYVVVNRAHSTKLVDYLVVFFVVYASIWLLGNDNLGTAIRLRIFNYTAALIAFFVIYQKKSISRGLQLSK